MAKIAVLPQNLINRIAAGEVVERPASVLKELLENSLDAGATRISVDIEDGGKKLIRVTDNGSGMEAADLALAFEAHATSKITDDEDLYAIGTLGFRGEALASIASVAQVEAISRPTEAIEGARIEINGGEHVGPTPTSAGPGTLISVRNLFYNTPARRKFLRTTNTEMGHIVEQFSRIALAHPELHLSLSHNGRELHDLPAGQSCRERIGVLFSREVADGLIPIERQDREMHISGLIAPPQQSRANTQWQYVFLNHRYIRDRFIAHAVREAYRGLLETNRQPVVFLFVEMPPETVDVNVHPAKIEVRFENSNVVHSAVLAALRDRLLSSDLSVPLGEAGGSISGRAVDSSDAERGQTEHEREQRVRQAMADFFKSTPPPTQHGSVPSQATRTSSVSTGAPK